MVNLNKMVSFEELKARFPEGNVAPYGLCLVVPGAEFDPDWEAQLADQGVVCHEAVLDRKPVTLVQIKKAPIEESEKVVYAPEAEKQAGLQRVLKGKNTPLGPRWTEDEYKLLIKLWNEHKKVGDIAANFPNRSGHAITCALARLHSSGAIERRWTQKKNRFSKKEPSARVQIPAHDEKSTDHSDESKVPSIGTEELLKEILDCLRGFEPVTFAFECHCRKCGDNRSVHDEDEVWRVCPRCGEPLIVWNVAYFGGSEK